MMRLLPVAAAVLLSLTLSAGAQAPPHIDFLEVRASGFADPADVVAPGKIRRIFSRPQAAAAHVGTAFGMTVRAIGQPEGSEVVLRWVWKVPRPGIKDKGGKLVRQVSEEAPVNIGAEQRRSFEFKDKADIVPGKWRVEVWNGNRRLAVRRFAIR